MSAISCPWRIDPQTFAYASRFVRHTVVIAAVSALIWLTATLPFASAAKDLSARLQPLIDAHEGEVGVMVKHLESGESFAHREDTPMPTASLIKFPLMVATYQAIEEGTLQPDQLVTLRKEEKVPGSGILTSHFSDGTTFPLFDAIRLMMSYSDNTATNLVIDRVGLDATAKQMKSLGCPNTVLHSKVFLRKTSIYPERSRQFGLGSTTAAEMIRLLEMLQKRELVSDRASQQMVAHMSAIGSRAKFPRLLPLGVTVVHKGGSVSASRCDAGIILSPNGPIAICVLTAKNKDRRWSDDNAAEMLCSHIAKQAYDHFNEGAVPPDPAVAEILKLGANGLLVEALQRTLNARLEPSPRLSVDGDFGPMTQQAVIDFQRSKKLEEAGEVGPETWKALGTLVEEESSGPDPDIVNAEIIEKQPADALTGPPHVTCKAWAIGDGKTGELLWGFQEDERRDIASTTKIMTAYLVTSFAEKRPEVLSETIVFSKRADETGGSTSGIRAGEQLSVEELLYGLLLPSGNDASVALAEHFGARLDKGSEGDGDSDSYERFIAAMNHTAQQLGMKLSSFANPNGLPQEGHQACAADLLTLAYHAMQQPLFRKYVETVQHGCTVSGPGGYQRNLFWRNTNHLLRTEGYQGVKTGTTNAAGSCLVSQEGRGDRSLIVVVLGATSTDARYVDSRNLYRWAWRQLGFGDETDD
ncbi:MAG: serine hydrolase [Planctomycetes bacterium]|nr:serine hydrolase [Planctomycetota bacterium]